MSTRRVSESTVLPKNIIAVDVGGTNTNIGHMVFDGTRWILARRWRFASQSLKTLDHVLQTVCRELSETSAPALDAIIVGVAGRIRSCANQGGACVTATNSDIIVNQDDIIRVMNAHVWLINDFELVAYGIDHMSPDQYTLIGGQYRLDAHQPRACIGAGTGLGTVYITPATDDIVPGVVMPSEGGHTVVSVPLSSQDMDILARMGAILGTHRISYEDVLAGRGLITVYQALQSFGGYTPNAITQQIAQEGLRPDHITTYAEQDPLCREALSWYQRWYGQYAQTVALTGLTLGGLYIVGGIIAHNPDLPASPMFQSAFLEHPRHGDLLRAVPVAVVHDYDISLYGAAWYYSNKVLVQ